MPQLPLVIFADHSGVMVLGSDPAVVPSPQVEASVLASLLPEDASVLLHGERRAEFLEGCTFPSLKQRSDKVRLLVSLLHTFQLAYTVTTPSDHKSSGFAVGPPRSACPSSPVSARDAGVSGDVAALWSLLDAYVK